MPNYIIDFNRVNQLSMHPKDTESSGPMGGILSPHGISRKIIKEYLDIYVTNTLATSRGRTVSDEKIQIVVDTLLYNGILIDPRDHKLNQILD